MSAMLTTKLQVPPVRAREQLVPRPKLLARLKAGLASRLTLLSAPAGFGKTTLLSSASQELAIPMAWLSLEEEDSDPARFLAYLAAALDHAYPGLGRSALEVLENLVPVRAAELTGGERWARSVLTTLINEISAYPEACWLVLDDLHLIQEPAVHRLLGMLLEHQPDHLHLVLSGRTDPPLALARLRARGQMVELRERDLRFSEPETTIFLNQVMGLGLSAEEVATLEARTEGWAAGLQLAALAMSGEESPGQFVQELTGSHRFMLDYLAEEVLQRQPEELRSFLLDTAVLDRLCGPLCDAVTGRADGQRMLERLEAANLFLVPLDHTRQWYRYHRLFADFLQAQLARRAPFPGGPQALHRRAAAWYEENGLIPEAVDHALAAGDHAGAARLISQVGRELMKRSEIAAVLRWVEALPAERLAGQPELNLTYAWALLASSRIDEVQIILERVEEADPEGRLAGEVAAVRALQAGLRADPQRATQEAQKALAQISEEDPFIRGLVAMNLAIPLLMEGKLEPAIRAFEEAVRMSLKSGNLVVAVICQCQIAEAHMVAGRLHRAAGLCQEAAAMATGADGRPLPMAGMAYALLGEIYREWDRLEAAEEQVRRGVELTQHWHTLEIGTFDGFLYWSRIREALGDQEGALALMGQLEGLAKALEALILDDLLVAIHQIRLWLALGDLEAARRRIAEWGLEAWPGRDTITFAGETVRQLPTLDELLVLVLARFWIRVGEAGRALEALPPVLSRAEALGRGRSVIEGLAIQALAYQALGKRENALESLGRALALAAPEGFARLFLDEGEPMRALLQEAVARGVSPAYGARLLGASSRAPEASQQPSEEPLTERELQVLALIAAGLSNREIAERLVLAHSTVKWHINQLYQKLGVSSRTQALRRGRELDLLQ